MGEYLYYQCHKKVHASLMTRAEYCQKKDLELGYDNADELGYLVIYNRNTEDHYTSWSPKKVFEEGYIQIEEGAGLVMVSEEKHDRLIKRNQLLCSLEAAGVDNWCGWDDAVDIRNAWNEEDE